MPSITILLKLQHKARCRQAGFSAVDRIIDKRKYYLDGMWKRDSSKKLVAEKHYLIQALLEQYNEDQKLSGKPTYELEGLVAEQLLYEDQDHRWYYQFNFTANKKEAGGSSTCDLFFAEVSNMKTEHACEVNCCRKIKHRDGDSGECSGCKNNGSPSMKHPLDTDAYTIGHLDGYLPFGLESESSSDEEESEARMRAIYKGLDEPDYLNKLRRLAPGRGMRIIVQIDKE